MRNMKDTLKSIVTMVLAVAILVTGVLSGGTTTAYAMERRTELENLPDLKNTTITMKIGDIKGIEYWKAYGDDLPGQGYNWARDYEWSTSDASVVSLVCEYFQTDADTFKNTYTIDYAVIKAEKAGTATITATDRTGGTESFTVIVEGQKMTAKQKKCKHAWKTTKKAACLMSGMKTCKKCKLQKVVAKKDHEWETQTSQKVTYQKYIVYVCGDCTNENPEHDCSNSTICDYLCFEEFSEKEYGSKEAAEDAYWKHRASHKHSSNSLIGQYNYKMLTDFDKPVKYEYVTVTRCKICQCTPETIEEYYK